MDIRTAAEKNIGFHFFIIFLYFTTGYSQINTKEILINNTISESGQYVSYFTIVNNLKNCFVKDVVNDSIFEYPGVNEANVLTDDYFIGLSRNDKVLYITDLKRYVTETLPNISSFIFDAQLKKIAYSIKDQKKMVLHNLKTNEKIVFDDIEYFNYSEELHQLLLIKSSKEIIILNTDDEIGKKILIKHLNGQKVKNCLWDIQSKSFVLFVNDSDSFKILRFTKNKLVEVYEDLLVNENLKHKVDTMFLNVRLLKDKKIALGLYNKNREILKQSNLEVWLGNSDDISPSLNSKIMNQTQLGILDISKKEIKIFSRLDSLVQYKIASNDQTIYEIVVKEEMTKQYPTLEVNYYDLNLKFKTKIGTFENNKTPIFNSRHLKPVYFKKGLNWVSFDKGEDFHIGKENDLNLPVYQNFSVFKKQWLIFNDSLDIWFYNSKKDTFQRKTYGSATNKKYQVLSCNYSSYNLVWNFSTERNIENYNDILVKWHSLNFETEGLCLINENSEIINLFETTDHLDQIKRSKSKFSYLKERVNSPPALYIYDSFSGTEKLVYQSNENDSLAKEVVSNYIEWINKDGDIRGALIRFPMKYDPKLKYPAIFSIYEKRSHVRNLYKHPSEVYGNLINFRQYISEGYFIIEPDIYVKQGAPGFSASKDVEEALDVILSKFNIDSEKIGIIGHSFGGYETNFIITQTNRFKVAVSSSSVSDLINFYHTINWTTLKPDMWRMETQQWRFGSGFYDNQDRYYQNSPINHLNNVNTPLLLIAGKKDFQVNWNQSITMFLGLKRLEKDVNLLLYDNEGHTLQNSENKVDADTKIKEWFDFYLKEKEKPDWLIQNL